MAKQTMPRPGTVQFTSGQRSRRHRPLRRVKALPTSRPAVTMRASRPTNRAETDETDPGRRQLAAVGPQVGSGLG